MARRKAYVYLYIYMHQKTEQGTYTDILLSLNPYNYVLYISKKLYLLTLSLKTSWPEPH